MKIKIITLMYAIIIAGMLGSCKKSSKPENVEETLTDSIITDTTTTEIPEILPEDTIRAKTSKMDTVVMAVLSKKNEYIKGSLKLKEDGTIDAYFELKVKKGLGYYLAGDPLILKKNYNAVSFRYRNILGQKDNDENDMLYIKFNFKNKYEWKEGDTVRIMGMNENSKKSFESLKPYFEERMNYFKNKDVFTMDLRAFNKTWNDKQSDKKLRVATYPDKDPKKPRLAKGDLILTVK